VYGFDKLGPPPKSLSQTSDKKTVSSMQAAPTPPGDNDIYAFDRLPQAPQVPKKASNSSNVKEDLQHIQYTSKQQTNISEDIYAFDHLNTSKLQQRVQRPQKTAYDAVPLPVPKPRSPSPPDDQDEYIEPIDEEVLKDIKESQTYDKLSAVMIEPTLNHSPVTEQQPPQLPKKKKATGGLDSPAKPSPVATVSQRNQPSSYVQREPPSPVKVVVPLVIASDNGSVVSIT